MNIPLNIDWQQILLHLFNFSILVGGLYLLLFKPVKNFMDKRAKHYQDMETAAAEREKATAETGSGHAAASGRAGRGAGRKARRRRPGGRDLCPAAA